MGYSIGKWIDENGDGRYDVLEVETRLLKGPRTFDPSGVPLHKDNQTVVKERFYLDKANPNILHDDVTTIDTRLTRPGRSTKVHPRTQSDLGRGDLQRGQRSPQARRRGLHDQRRRLHHAGEEEPGAARSEVSSTPGNDGQRRPERSNQARTSRMHHFGHLAPLGGLVAFMIGGTLRSSRSRRPAPCPRPRLPRADREHCDLLRDQA